MRISISGTSCVGKSTFIADFCQRWPMYTPCKFTYRELLTDHSKATTKDTQWMILNNMIDELQKHDRTANIFYDRCPLDNLVYTLWASTQPDSDVDDEFVGKCVPLVRESMRLLDMMMFVPLTQASPVAIIDNGTRETDVQFIEEIDNIFKAVVDQYRYNLDATNLFPRDDCPGVIEIFGKPQERIMLASHYINAAGDIIGDEGGSILDPNNLDQMMELLQQQKGAAESEKFVKQQTDMVKKFIKRGTNFTKPKRKR